jgi:hypothetical protein
MADVLIDENQAPVAGTQTSESFSLPPQLRKQLEIFVALSRECRGDNELTDKVYTLGAKLLTSGSPEWEAGMPPEASQKLAHAIHEVLNSEYFQPRPRPLEWLPGPEDFEYLHKGGLSELDRIRGAERERVDRPVAELQKLIRQGTTEKPLGPQLDNTIEKRWQILELLEAINKNYPEVPSVFASDQQLLSPQAKEQQRNDFSQALDSLFELLKGTQLAEGFPLPKMLREQLEIFAALCSEFQSAVGPGQPGTLVQALGAALKSGIIDGSPELGANNMPPEARKVLANAIHAVLRSESFQPASRDIPPHIMGPGDFPEEGFPNFFSESNNVGPVAKLRTLIRQGATEGPFEIGHLSGPVKQQLLEAMEKMFANWDLSGQKEGGDCAFHDGLKKLGLLLNALKKVQVLDDLRKAPASDLRERTRIVTALARDARTKQPLLRVPSALIPR